MTTVFHFDGSEALRDRVEKLGITLCPESDPTRFEKFLPEIEVLWHVLKPVTADVIDRAPKLKLIQKIGIGVNTIDLEAAKRRGIPVCNLPGTNTRAVAEMALLLMLACLRRLPQLDASARNGDWFGAWKLQDYFGEIGGRSVGLVGYGAVAKALRPILEALGAKVLYWSRSHKNTEFESLVANSDIVSMHLPLVPETASILNPLKMKRGAILINTARGGLVDHDLLMAALQSGHLAAAGLDVFAQEPLPREHPLLTFPNVVCAPHLAWLTRETLDRSLSIALENLRRLQAGEPLLNRVA